MELSGNKPRFALSNKQLEEGSRVVTNYRNSICGMGPFFDDFIIEALQSEKKRTDIAKNTEDFFNNTYFIGEENNNFSYSSKDLLGIDIYHGKCKVTGCDLVGNGTTLLGHFKFNIGVFIPLEVVGEDIYSKFKDVEYREGNRVKITHKYETEAVFCKVEQFLLFMRALWYFTESLVLNTILTPIKVPSSVGNILQKYLDERKSLISPFIHQNGENHFQVKNAVKSLKANDLEKYYLRFFFSKLSGVQKKCANLSVFIKKWRNLD